MSYDVSLRKDGKVVQTDKHQIRGGTYQVGGTEGLWLNITYNYGKHFAMALGEGGIRKIYGMTAEGSIPVLQEAIGKLGEEVDEDYWKPTEGNARAALEGLLQMAKICPHRDAIWTGD